MKNSLLLLVLAMTTTPAIAADEVPFYIGTYTSSGGSRGIYRAVLNTQTGKLAQPELAAEASGPSFVALHPNGKFLYAVHEPTDGEVSAYAIEADGQLKKLNTQSSGGGVPCHVSVSPDGKTVFTANYGAGSLASFPLEADGALAAPATKFQNTGSGPDKARQEGPHLHSIYADKENRFVYACDLGTDEVLVFHLDPKAGTLTLAEPRSAKVPAGGGPRHLAFNPDERFVFANNEMTSTVTALRRDPKTGALTAFQTLSTLPGGKPVPGNSTSEIELHPNGKWLYVSNRGDNSIAVFNVANDGKLSVIEVAPAGVAVPRGFGIDPSGRWLVAAGQDSNDLTALAIDSKTGKLSPGPNKITVGKPVCVAFVQP
jgi:6-phosphogluconolactonase